MLKFPSPKSIWTVAVQPAGTSTSAWNVARRCPLELHNPTWTVKFESLGQQHKTGITRGVAAQLNTGLEQDAVAFIVTGPKPQLQAQGNIACQKVLPEIKIPLPVQLMPPPHATLTAIVNAPVHAGVAEYDPLTIMFPPLVKAEVIDKLQGIFLSVKYKLNKEFLTPLLP